MENNLGLVLVEFDSLKGPVIRKRNPQNYTLPKLSLEEEFLMWIIRSSEFSVRKIEQQTAYAKAISLADPNFSRKKRQFGLAIISKLTFELSEAEIILNELIRNCLKNSDNKSYFKMLNGLLQTVKNFELPENILLQSIKSTKEDVLKQINNTAKFDEKIEEQNQLPHIIISSKLQIFNKITLKEKRGMIELVVGKPEGFETFKQKQQMNISSDKIDIDVLLQNYSPTNLHKGLEIFIQILESTKELENKIEKIIIGIEFLDRLLYEDVDIEYYLPFIQYLLSMENYSITEFKEEEFGKQLVNLRGTHGDWINSLIGKNFDGMKLTQFFNITGIKREGLELLIDLLFTKLITIY